MKQSSIDRRCCSAALAYTVLALALFSLVPSAFAQARTVLSGATLIDATGAPPLADSRIIIDKGLIICVSGPDGCKANPGEAELNLTGRYITPGLIDTHVHLNFENNREEALAEQALRFAFGITASRDAGTRVLDAALTHRSEAADPERPTPRLLVSARVSEQHAKRFGAKGAALVRALDEHGVDAIKLKDQLSVPAMTEVINAANKSDLPVFGHTWLGPPPVSMTQEAVEAGANGIVHLLSFAPWALREQDRTATPESLGGEDAFWPWRKSLWLRIENEDFDPLIDLMVERHVWLEPNLVWEFNFGRFILPPTHMPFLRHSIISLRERISGDPRMKRQQKAVYPEAYKRMASFVRRFHERGGMVVTGGDGQRPGIDIHIEMQLLRSAGLSAMASLQAATRDAAMALGRSSTLGTVEVSKRADLVIFDANPLAASENTWRIHRVVKGGVIHNPEIILGPYKERHAARIRAYWISRGTKVGLGLLVVFVGIGVALRLRRNRIRRSRQQSG